MRAGSLFALLLLAVPGWVSAATLEGQVLHVSGSEVTGDLPVRLLGLTSAGGGVRFEGRTDATGAFRFTDLPTPAAYLAMVDYAGVAFPADGVHFTATPESAEATKSVMVMIHEPTHDSTAVILESVLWIVEQELGAFRINQRAEFQNTGDRVVVAETGSPSPLRVGLAPGHGEVLSRSAHGPDDFDVRGDVLEFGGAVFPGSREIAFSYTVATGGPELGAFRINQRAEFQNTGDRVVVAETGSPSPLRVGLAPGHGEVLSRSAHGPDDFDVRGDVLEFGGAVFPGSREIAFSYTVATVGPELRSEILFPDDTRSFELYVADRGIQVEARPLHVARVSRDEEGTLYQRYVGFDLAAGTRIPLVIRPRPPRPTSSPLGSAIAVSLLGGLLVFLVGRPLTLAPEEGAPVRDEAASAEKEALYAALRDLEDDFATGKLSSEDRDRLRGELRRDTLRALARARAPDAPTTEAPRVCACGRAIEPTDRFCAGCGRPL